jgi:hypothetical protein
VTLQLIDYLFFVYKCLFQELYALLGFIFNSAVTVMVRNLLSCHPHFALEATKLHDLAFVFQMKSNGCSSLEHLSGLTIVRALREILSGADGVVLFKIFVGLRYFTAIALNLKLVKVSLQNSVEFLVECRTHISPASGTVLGDERGHTIFAEDDVALGALSGISYDHKANPALKLLVLLVSNYQSRV